MFDWLPADALAKTAVFPKGLMLDDPLAKSHPFISPAFQLSNPERFLTPQWLFL